MVLEKESIEFTKVTTNQVGKWNTNFLLFAKIQCFGNTVWSTDGYNLLDFIIEIFRWNEAVCSCLPRNAEQGHFPPTTFNVGMTLSKSQSLFIIFYSKQKMREVLNAPASLLPFDVCDFVVEVETWGMGR